MERRVIELDLQRVNLFGWEEYKSDLVINSLVYGLSLGDKLPPVNVLQIDPFTYQLARHNIADEERLDGGHCRSVASRQAKIPLRAIIESRTSQVTEPINLRDVILVDDALIDDRNFYRKDKVIIPVTSFREASKRSFYRQLPSHG
tara:strand:+ start:1734 stop:2171 length:438 start_codon:yes stop_codon:yes gene_type:complete